MGFTLDHRPGHTITLRRSQALGVGIGCMRLGEPPKDRKILPVQELGRA